MTPAERYARFQRRERIQAVAWCLVTTLTGALAAVWEVWR